VVVEEEEEVVVVVVVILNHVEEVGVAVVVVVDAPLLFNGRKLRCRTNKLPCRFLEEDGNMPRDFLLRQMISKQ
jgi:hypothetical protein